MRACQLHCTFKAFNVHWLFTYVNIFTIITRSTYGIMRDQKVGATDGKGGGGVGSIHISISNMIILFLFVLMTQYEIKRKFGLMCFSYIASY